MDKQKKSERLEKIKEENKRYEKETPYNFCDRWCERCAHEKQKSCKLYQDEFEQKLTCIAYGKEPNDPEITMEVMKKQHEGLEKIFEDHEEELDIDFNEIDDPEFKKIKEHMDFVESNPLQVTAERYLDKAHEFLEAVFYKNTGLEHELTYDLETISWYHTLLPVKLNRALAGFHEPACEGDISLCDAVAQFEICKKAIDESSKAFKKIKQHFPSRHAQISEFIAILSNMRSRIELLEKTI